VKIGRHLQCGKCSSHSVHVGNNLLTVSNLGRANPKFLQLVKHIDITQIPARRYRFRAFVSWEWYTRPNGLDAPFTASDQLQPTMSAAQILLNHAYILSLVFSIIILQWCSELVLVASLKHSSLLGRHLIPRNVLDSACCFSTSNFYNNNGTILAWWRVTYNFWL
jgi:hypothetical protein